ncbi:uncharacterized protein [Venturia canescens]|nr:uncharacterized protein LOC122411965 isoform X2 [Venturia canescens]XP_043277055.1 uncharacterized protein LOC122411965 isoform X2 [Venturia canescens]
MEIQLNGTLENVTRTLNNEFAVADKAMGSIISEISLKDPFLLTLDRTRYVIDNESKRSHDCSEFLKQLFEMYRQKVDNCSKLHLNFLSKNHRALAVTLQITLTKFERFKAEAIECDKNATTIVNNMMDAYCVRRITIKLKKIERKITNEFSTVVRIARKMKDTWTRNIIDCIATNETPLIVENYLKKCDSRLDVIFNPIKQN